MNLLLSLAIVFALSCYALAMGMTLLRLFRRLELSGPAGGETAVVFGRFEAENPNDRWTGEVAYRYLGVTDVSLGSGPAKLDGDFNSQAVTVGVRYKIGG